jgi:hypothetical protein
LQRDHFIKGAILTGHPSSALGNDFFRQAIPGLPTAEVFAPKYTQLAKQVVPPLADKLRRCESLALQFDLWGSTEQQKFLGVICQSLCDGRRFECSLGTIPLDPRTASAPLIAAKLNELVERFEIAPIAWVADMNGTDNRAIATLNDLRTRSGKPTLHAFPCICQFFNRVLKAFMENVPEDFISMKLFAERFDTGPDSMELCEAPRTIRRMVSTMPCSPSQMAMTINDLIAEIRNLTTQIADGELKQAAEALTDILSVAFASPLHVFERDALNPGNGQGLSRRCQPYSRSS